MLKTSYSSIQLPRDINLQELMSDMSATVRIRKVSHTVWIFLADSSSHSETRLSVDCYTEFPHSMACTRKTS